VKDCFSPVEEVYGVLWKNWASVLISKSFLGLPQPVRLSKLLYGWRENFLLALRPPSRWNELVNLEVKSLPVLSKDSSKRD